MKIGLTSGLICLFLGLSLAVAQGFELQASTYKLENPEWGYYKLIIEAYLPEAENGDSFVIFQSKYFETNILKAKAIDYAGNEIKTEINVTEEGYFSVLVSPALRKVQTIKVEIDIIDPNSFQIENNKFSFNKEIPGGQLITVVLPRGYGLLEGTYSASKEKFPFHVVAAKLE